MFAQLQKGDAGQEGSSTCLLVAMTTSLSLGLSEALLLQPEARWQAIPRASPSAAPGSAW